MASIRCPGLLCRSTNCTPLTEKGKYSIGKGTLGGLIGGALIGPAGVIAGAASGLNGKKTVKMMCNKCGKVFTVKV